MTRAGRILLIILAAAGACRPAQAQEFRVKPDHTVVFGGQHLLPDYLPEFTVLFSAADPQLRMRPAGIPDVQYNVATWLSDRPELNRTDRRADQSGDGFDDEILEGSVESRTADLFNAGRIIVVRPVSHRAEETDKVTFGYPENDLFSIAAELTADTATGRPLLTYRLTAKTGGWYSVGFTGFAGRDPKRTDEIWQPLIWQEKRFPDKSYLTLAFRCPVPSAFVTYRNATYGILAHPAEFPFDPLPTAANSRFGVAVRDRQGLASPMLFAPVPGGIGSETAPGGELVFSALLCGERGDTTDALQNVAESLFGFTGNRNNALGSLNGTIENMISYILGPYSRFLDKEKGCTYATDVPGAVKNVSSLNPLEIAVLNDNRTMLLERALPVYEYVLSREKLLFCADSTQDIQYPSRRMNGPCCPVSELTALNSILKDNAPYLLSFAGKEYHSTRVRNLDVVEQGGTWRNAMHLYRATGEPGYLKKSRRGGRPLHPSAHRHAGCRGAKLYTQYVWYSPRRPGPGYFGQSRRESPALPIPQVERTCADGRSRRTGPGMAAFGNRTHPGIFRHEHRTPGYLHGQLRCVDAAAGALHGRRVSGTHGGPRRHRPLPQFSGLPHQHGPHDRIRKGGLSAPGPHGTGRQLLPLQPHHAAHIAALRFSRHAGPLPERREGGFSG
ncbi:MAG: hypothetical protein ACLRXZ_13505 [Alistipes finegoldii]|uniref:hypothetical protein n=1 Tax=Alistipes finegoldii TaxID=214856 RepID=UPI00399FF90F